MNHEKLMEEFKLFNEGEKFYKYVFDIYRNNHPDCKYITAEQFFEIVNSAPSIKENTPDAVFVLPDEFQDESFFTVDNGVNIKVLRHNRYTPLFFNKCSFYDVVIVIDGFCTHVVNNTTVTLKQGDICFVPPNMSHATATFSDSIVFNMLIRRSFFSDILFESFLQNNNILSNFFMTSRYCKKNEQYLVFHTDGDDDIINLLLEMHKECHNNQIFNKQILEHQIIILFAMLLRSHSDKVEPNFALGCNFDKSADFILYISRNISNITLDNIAKHFGYAPQYISRKIKKDTGLGYTEIVNQMRLKKAEQLLLKTIQPLQEISESVGYTSVESFIRFFKKNSGLSPAEYRKVNGSL